VHFRLAFGRAGRPIKEAIPERFGFIGSNISPRWRIKAKVTFTRTPEGDDFRVLEILSIPKL
jgi:hypothetical protein